MLGNVMDGSITVSGMGRSFVGPSASWSDSGSRLRLWFFAFFFFFGRAVESISLDSFLDEKMSSISDISRVG